MSTNDIMSNKKQVIMTPTLEQFKDFVSAVQKAQEKEKKLNKALKVIWDDDQGQFPPFYISPLWEAVYKAFNIMFCLKDDDIIGNELYWWLDNAPKGEAKYYIDKKEYNVSDIESFYDYLVEIRGRD